MNFRTEVCSKAKFRRSRCSGIKEIEVAKSLDDLITTKSITGEEFPVYEELEFDDGGKH